MEQKQQLLLMKLSLNKIFIAEDDVFISEHLKRIILNLGYEIYDIVSSFEMAKKSIDINNLPDLALLDIRMQNQDQGIEIAKYFKNLNVPFIYITSFSDKKTLNEAIVHQPIGYILKPFTSEEIENLLNKVFEELFNEFVYVKHKDKEKKLNIDEILFIKSDNNYLEIYTETKKYLIRFKLSELEKKLPKSKFIRVHQSYMVNKKFIIAFSSNTININNLEVPISRKYKHMLDLL